MLELLNELYYNDFCSFLGCVSLVIVKNAVVKPHKEARHLHLQIINNNFLIIKTPVY